VNVLDLFSGIGGFSLGLERAGMTTVAFCEIDPFCRRVLAKHWPDVPIYEDVRTVSARRLRADGIDVDVICGGFPCQDISHAGKGAGLAGERSGLWREFARIVGKVRPRYVIVENVAALLGRGMGDVLGDLAALGYDVEWHCIPAAAVGAPHRRDRVWIVAADAARFRVEGHGADRQQVALAPTLARLLGRDDAGDHWREWTAESPLRGVDDGVPARLDRPRLQALGNAVVPQIVELIGRAILSRWCLSR
jgi:DNA (cytosine-5)-methyltransferase 1